jgi:hypothetical protein
MFRKVRLSIIRCLFTLHSAMVYVIQLSSRSICSCSTAVYKPVWHTSLLSVHWINSWWWTEELSETCRISCQNKFVKLLRLVGFIIKKPSIFSPNYHNFELRNKIEKWKCMVIMLKFQQTHIYKYVQSHIIIFHQHVSLASVTTIIRVPYKENKINTKWKYKNIWQNH